MVDGWTWGASNGGPSGSQIVDSGVAPPSISPCLSTTGLAYEQRGADGFVVDDDPAVLKSLSRLLRSAQLTVVPFGSPQEFLERHDPQAPGCLVLDMEMPGLNGLELQKALTTKDSAVKLNSNGARHYRVFPTTTF